VTEKSFSEAVQEQHEELKRTINYHNKRYYLDDEPEIPDAEYDRLFAKIRALEKDFPQLITSDSPTQRVGATPLTEFESVTHEVPMLSLDNAFSAEDMVAFDKRIRDRLKDESIRIEYACEPKFDGIAVSPSLIHATPLPVLCDNWIPPLPLRVL